MHKYVMTRGDHRATRQWVEDLSAQYLPFEVKEKGSEEISKYLAQLQVRPVCLWEIVYPSESDSVVMGMLKPCDGKAFGGKVGKLAMKLTRLLGLKKPITNYKQILTPPGLGVSVLVLGDKKDKENWKKKPSGNELLDDGHTPREML